MNQMAQGICLGTDSPLPPPYSHLQAINDETVMQPLKATGVATGHWTLGHWP